jgi:hypothetical protein
MKRHYVTRSRSAATRSTIMHQCSTTDLDSSPGYRRAHCLPATRVTRTGTTDEQNIPFGHSISGHLGDQVPDQNGGSARGYHELLMSLAA